MEEETIRGTIEEVSSEVFVVSAVIAGDKKFFWCQRDQLFVDGSCFKGHLDEVLEEFMKLDVIIKEDEANGKVVVAAWVGEKPEIFEVGNTLPKSIYNQKGIINQNGQNLLIAPLQSDHNVLITRRDIVFLDGCQSEKGAQDFIGQTVSFDARPLSFKDPTGASFYATCVWIGEPEPKIDERFRLPPEAVVKQEKTDRQVESLESPTREVIDVGLDSDDDIQIVEVIQKKVSSPVLVCLDSEEDFDGGCNLFDKFAIGRVCVIAGPELALVDVCVDDVQVKAKLFRESVDEHCRDIRHVLSVGDRLCMLLRASNVGHSSIRWCVVKASKGCPNPKELAEMLLADKKAVVVKTEKVGDTATTETGNGELATGDAAVPVCNATGSPEVANGDSTEPVPIATGSPGIANGDRETGNEAPVVEDKPMETDNADSVPEAKSGIEEEATSNGEATEVFIKSEIKVLDEFAPRVTTLKPVTIMPIKRSVLRTEMILNGTGSLVKVGAYYLAEMNLLPIRVLIPPDSFYVNGILYNRSIYGQLGNEINFDAKVLKKKKVHTSGATHCAMLSWRGKKPSLQTVLKKVTVSPTNDLQLQPGTVYCGLVMEVPLPHGCIVKFGSVPVLVPAKSLFVDPWTKDTSPVVVSDYLKFGDYVALTCKKEGNCVVAEICGTLPSSNSLFGAVGTFNKTSLSEVKNNASVSEEEAKSQLYSLLKCMQPYLEEGVPYKGIITSFPFRNYAVATVGEIRVLVHVNRVRTLDENRNARDKDCIAELLTIGSTVFLWVERSLLEGLLFRGVCYSAKEARVIVENSVKNKAVLKNYRGSGKSIDGQRYVIKLLGANREVESEIQSFRLLGAGSGGASVVDKVLSRVSRRRNDLRVSVAVHADGEALHAVWV